MDTIIPAIQFVADHYKEVFAAIGALVTAATVVVKLTPTQQDDAILAKVVSVLNYFSVIEAKPHTPADGKSEG